MTKNRLIAICAILLGCTLSIPLHTMHGEWNDDNNREYNAGPEGFPNHNPRPNASAAGDFAFNEGNRNTSLWFLAAVGLGTVGSITYGIMEGINGDGRRDDIQMYEAVKAQQSWLLHNYIAGRITEFRLLIKVEKEGIKKSDLYQAASTYAETRVDYKTSLELKQRLEAAQNQELYAEIYALEKPNGASAPAQQSPYIVTTEQEQEEIIAPSTNAQSEDTITSNSNNSTSQTVIHPKS